MKLWMIRHGETEGNRLSRYIGGRTDEPLSAQGIQTLYEMKPFWSMPSVPLDGEDPFLLFTSPMIRCRQTAEILFPDFPVIEIEDLRECDFGKFENKNYKELSGDPDYQAWIDSNATIPFPGGESREQSLARNIRGFQQVMNLCKDPSSHAVLIIHGGTIMNLMSVYSEEKKDFYDWHVGNGHGYRMEADLVEWESGTMLFHKIREQ